MKRLFIFLCVVISFAACTQAEIEITSKGIALPDNTVVHYLEAGQGPVLILVHGLGASSESWRPAMLHLAKRYHVIAPDLRGYGKSDKPRADYSVAYHASELNSFIDALGVKKTALAGNSMGGWIAALTALDHPDKVSHLVLVASAGLKRDTLPPVDLNPVTREQMQALLLALFADKALVTTRMIDEQWEYRREVRATVAATLASFSKAVPFLDGRLQDIRTPTLIVWGRQDQLIPLDQADRFAKGIPGARLVVFENTGHLPQYERPKEFYGAVKGFVTGW